MLGKIVFLALLIIMMLVPSKHALHMFQQNRYELKRYSKWLKANIKFKPLLIGLVLLVVYYLTPLRNIRLCDVVAGLLAIYSISKEEKKEYIKPLVYTARVIRQIIVLVIVDLVVLVLLINLLSDHLMIVVYLAYVMNWVLIYVMAIITAPVENFVQKGFINDAKKILRSYDKLTIVGITGSYGKTSSKNILQAILSDKFRSLMTPASFNTPMGVTITIREHLKPTHQIFICEMGADKVNDIQFLCDFVHPKIGLVTSIGPQHLNTFGSIENIINEKMKMIENLPSDGLGVINVDNEYIRNYHVKNNCQLVTYGIYHDADYQACDIVYSPKGSKFNVLYDGVKYPFETKLLGEHNIMNILAAIAIARYLGVDFDKLATSVKNVQYVEHRLEVKKINGYTFIDNAFNSNPSGASMSLKVMSMMPNKRFIVTPGLIDLGDKQDEINKDLGKQMKDQVDVVILVGPIQTKAIYEGLSESGFDMNNVYVTKTVKEAFALVYQLADTKDTILLENDLPDAFNV